jgi:AcrR family transcriptional regulator
MRTLRHPREAAKRRPVARTYRQNARARQTEANTHGIVRAAVGLVRRAPVVADVTLDDIARESGLTVRTVLRRFGSRDGVLEAAFAQLKEDLKSARVPTAPGDVAAAVTSLIDQYEQMGDFNIRALEQEQQLPLLHAALNEGRRHHRAWVAEVFGPYLAHLPAAERERRITSLYAATDVYLWKLLRRDLGHDRRALEDTFHHLVRGALVLTNTQPPPKGGK